MTIHPLYKVGGRKPVALSHEKNSLLEKRLF